MKFATVVAAVLAVAFSQVEANGQGGGGFFGHGGGHVGGGGGDGGYPEAFYDCACPASSSGRNPCSHNSSSFNAGCNENSVYAQCANNVCTNATCPNGGVWNKTQGACVSCPAQQHVRADGVGCVCNKGMTETFNPTTMSGSCGPCPTGSTELPDSCFCPNGTVFIRSANNCTACPANASPIGQTCNCTDGQYFFDATSWTCKICPGNMVTPTTAAPPPGSHRGSPPAPKQQCQCNTAQNEIFYRPTVTCFTCPTGTNATVGGAPSAFGGPGRRPARSVGGSFPGGFGPGFDGFDGGFGGGYCACPKTSTGQFQFFNMTSGVCQTPPARPTGTS